MELYNNTVRLAAHEQDALGVTGDVPALDIGPIWHAALVAIEARMRSLEASPSINDVQVTYAFVPITTKSPEYYALQYERIRRARLDQMAHGVFTIASETIRTD